MLQDDGSQILAFLPCDEGGSGLAALDFALWAVDRGGVTAPAAVPITGPATSSTDTTPTVTWNTVSGAHRYHLLVTRTTDGVVIVNNTNLTGTSLNIGTPQKAGGYQVKMRAVNDKGDAGAWSTRNFTITALPGPTITGPATNSTDTTPRLGCRVVKG